VTQEEFIRGVSVEIQQGSIRTSMSELSNEYQQPETELSRWFLALSPTEKERVAQVVRLAVDGAVFSFLCVLDGVATVEEGHDKGELQLFYVKRDVSVRLNRPGEELHGLFREYMAD
jgi:hypothetical protein